MMHVEPHDPRPDDMAELARQTAVELRKPHRGLHADAIGIGVYVLRPNGPPGSTHGGGWFPHNIIGAQFDNLGPVACADEIQRLEAQRAQEWAGDV
jgi:hypothetical protein